MTQFPSPPPSSVQPFRLENTRTVLIPNAPADLNQGAQQYNIDLTPFSEITDENVDYILSHVPSYRMTLRWWAWLSKNVLQTVEGQRILHYATRTGESKTHIRDYFLPSDHDWTAWKAQYEWLKYAFERLSEVLEAARTYSANRRPEGGRQFHPAM